MSSRRTMRLPAGEDDRDGVVGRRAGGTAPLARCFHRRVRLWERADQLGNVPLACRQLGISRTRYYEWSKIADAYGVNA